MACVDLYDHQDIMNPTSQQATFDRWVASDNDRPRFWNQFTSLKKVNNNLCEQLHLKGITNLRSGTWNNNALAHMNHSHRNYYPRSSNRTRRSPLWSRIQWDVVRWKTMLYQTNTTFKSDTQGRSSKNLLFTLQQQYLETGKLPWLTNGCYDLWRTRSQSRESDYPQEYPEWSW